MSVILNGNLYVAADFIGPGGRGYAEIFPATGLPTFPDSIFTDMLAELAAVPDFDALSFGAAGSIMVSSGSAWIRAVSATITSAGVATFTSVVGPLTGNADTASLLETPRNINGVAFDGGSNITVPAAAGTLTGGVLNAPVLASSLTSLGTITALRAADSGLGIAISSSTFVNLAIATAGKSSLRMGHGTTPSSPVNGDVWTTTAGMFVRVSGVTIGPLAASGGTLALGGLTDVTLTAVATNEILQKSSGDWINRTFAEAGIVGSVTGGAGIASSGGVNPDITLDFNDVATGGTPIAGDGFMYADGTLTRRINIDQVPLGIFNNDQNWTSNSGDITRVNITAGNGLTGNVNTASGDHVQTINAVGTTNRISVSAGAINIHTSYVGQATITTLGTITTGSIPAARMTGGTLAGNYTFSSRLRVIAGSAAAPSLVGPSVLDTGIYFPTATAIGIAVEGILRMLFQRVDANEGHITVSNSQFGIALVTADIASAIDWDRGNVQTLDNDTGTTSITMTGGIPGFTYVLIVDPGTGASTSLTWPSGVAWFNGGTQPTWTVTTSNFDVAHFLCIATDTYMGSANVAHV